MTVSLGVTKSWGFVSFCRCLLICIHFPLGGALLPLLPGSFATRALCWGGWPHQLGHSHDSRLQKSFIEWARVRCKRCTCPLISGKRVQRRDEVNHFMEGSWSTTWQLQRSAVVMGNSGWPHVRWWLARSARPWGKVSFVGLVTPIFTWWPWLNSKGDSSHNSWKLAVADERSKEETEWVCVSSSLCYRRFSSIPSDLRLCAVKVTFVQSQGVSSCLRKAFWPPEELNEITHKHLEHARNYITSPLRIAKLSFFQIIFHGRRSFCWFGAIQRGPLALQLWHCGGRSRCPTEVQGELAHDVSWLHCVLFERPTIRFWWLELISSILILWKCLLAYHGHERLGLKFYSHIDDKQRQAHKKLIRLWRCRTGSRKLRQQRNFCGWGHICRSAGVLLYKHRALDNKTFHTWQLFSGWSDLLRMVLGWIVGKHLV